MARPSVHQREVLVAAAELEELERNVVDHFVDPRSQRLGEQLVRLGVTSGSAKASRRRGEHPGACLRVAAGLAQAIYGLLGIGDRIVDAGPCEVGAGAGGEHRSSLVALVRVRE